MRKSLGMAVLVIVLCVGLGVTGFVRLNESGKQIRYEETVLYGDKSAIDGLTLVHQLYAQIAENGRYLYWDTTYRPASGIAEAEYTYREKKLETPVESKEYLSIRANASGGVHTTGTIDLEKEGGVWAQVLLDVAERAGEELSYSESVNLNDYFEYYPLSISVNIGTLQIYSDSGMWNSDLEQWMKILQDEFRVSIPEKSNYVKVEIFKRTDGGVYAYSISPVEWSPSFSTYSLVTEKDCYFLVKRREEDVASSQVMGFWAIYRIPYETTEDAVDREKTVLHMEEMEKLVSGDSEISLHDINYNEKWDQIEIVYTEEFSTCNLMVVDGKTGENRIIPLTFKGEWQSIYKIYHYDDFMIITLGEDGEKGFVLINQTDEGDYQKVFEGEFPKENISSDMIVDTSWFISPYNTIGADYDGKRLAIAAAAYEYKDESLEKCGIHLVAYEEGEMIFHGLYVSSLRIGTENDNLYKLWNETPVRVSWD